MKINVEKTNIERSGVSAESNFTIKTTAKAFDILSSGLYSDKILAVIRELSCNAYDAHIAAGKADVPFEIHLPTPLEPFFSVKDFGIGLSDEQIHGLYTTYFDSTKTESNDFIGALGLGSKSPFSYTKSFEVIANYNGTKNIYSIFINEGGVPTVAQMGSVKTDECNGIEVKMATKPEDCHRFREKAEQALAFFDTFPTVNGNAIHLEKPKPKIEGKNWRVIDVSSWNNKFVAIQGNVPYIIDRYMLELSEKAAGIVDNMELVVDFNIGDLEVAASREALQYDDRTKKNIEAKLEEIADDILGRIVKETRKFKTTWDLFVGLEKLSNNLFNSPYMIKNIFNKVTTKNKKINKYLNNEGKVDFRSVSGSEFPTCDVATYRSPKRMHQKRATRTEMRTTISPHHSMVVMINDVKTGGIARITEWLDGNEDKSVVAIKSVKLDRLPEDFDYDKEIQDLIKAIGSPKFTYVSDLPKPTKTGVKRTHTNVYELTVFEKEVGYYSSRTKKVAKWEQTDLDLEKGGIYVPLKNRRYMVNGDNELDVSPDTKQHLVDLVGIIGEWTDIDTTDLHETVHGVTSKVEKKLQKMDNWHNLFDVLPEIASKLVKYRELHCNYAYTLSHSGFVSLLCKDDSIQDKVRNMNDGHFKSTVLDLVDQRDEAMEHASTIRVLGQFHMFDYGYESKLLIDRDDLNKKYPMFKFVDTYSVDIQTIETIIEYIELTEEKGA